MNAKQLFSGNGPENFNPRERTFFDEGLPEKYWFREIRFG